MDSLTFNKVMDDQFKKSRDMLAGKAKQYATDDDRLHNFRVTAVVRETDMAGALAGMMIKHTISVYDMINKEDTTSFTKEQWDEKITDHINYLILLQAVLAAERAKLAQSLTTEVTPEEAQAFQVRMTAPPEDPEALARLRESLSGFASLDEAEANGIVRRVAGVSTETASVITKGLLADAKSRGISAVQHPVSDPSRYMRPLPQDLRNPAETN